MENLDQCRGLAIKAYLVQVILAAKFYAGNIAQQYLRAVRIRSHYDIAKLFRCFKASTGIDRIGKLRAFWCRFAADLARRYQHILCLYGAGNVRYGQVELGQLVRSYPDAHGVLGHTAAKYLGQTNAADSRQLVYQVNRCVIVEKAFVVGAVGRDQGNQ